jgi:hypothetical protein
VFSLLYGAEFLRRFDVVQKCEQTWWGGVRSFYGLPSGVSSAFLRLMFPRFSLVHRVLDSKYGLLVRGSRPLATLFPEALLFDRVFLFGKHRKGFSQFLYEWCEYLGVLDAFFLCDRQACKSALQARLSRLLDEDWVLFSTMSSARFASTLFGSRQALYLVALEASRLSRLGLRAFMLSVSGALSLSYCRSRSCFSCGARFDFEHFLTCTGLGGNLVPLLQSAVSNEDWRGFAFAIISRFQVFIHAVRAGELSSDESELFGFLDDAIINLESDSVGDVIRLFEDQTPS